MARARHARPSAWFAWLFPGRVARRRSQLLRESLLRQLSGELCALRELADVHAAAAAAARVRADAAEAAVRELRLELGRLREELLWAWADGRVPTGAVALPSPAPTVVDLRSA